MQILIDPDYREITIVTNSQTSSNRTGEASSSAINRNDTADTGEEAESDSDTSGRRR
jgi:hypothetical protein